MKKTTLTITIVLGMGMMAIAGTYDQNGLFKRGTNAENSGLYQNNRTIAPMLPIHGEVDNQDAPLGSGIALLLGLGGAYLMGKCAKRKEK